MTNGERAVHFNTVLMPFEGDVGKFITRWYMVEEPGDIDENAGNCITSKRTYNTAHTNHKP